MAIKTITKIVCDYCRKEEDQYIFNKPIEVRMPNTYLGVYTDYVSTCDTPLGWYTLDNISLQHRAKDNGKLIEDKNKFKSGDPHFCKKACLMNWILEKVNSI